MCRLKRRPQIFEINTKNQIARSRPNRLRCKFVIKTIIRRRSFSVNFWKTVHKNVILCTFDRNTRYNACTAAATNLNESKSHLIVIDNNRGFDFWSPLYTHVRRKNLEKKTIIASRTTKNRRKSFVTPLRPAPTSTRNAAHGNGSNPLHPDTLSCSPRDNRIAEDAVINHRPTLWITQLFCVGYFSKATKSNHENKSLRDRITVSTALILFVNRNALNRFGRFFDGQTLVSQSPY